MMRHRSEKQDLCEAGELSYRRGAHTCCPLSEKRTAPPLTAGWRKELVARSRVAPKLDPAFPYFSMFDPILGCSSPARGLSA